jgi:hypothetical protein
MENTFYYFGFIYILYSFYKLYDWSYGRKIKIVVDDSTTIDDLKDITEKINSQKKTVQSIISSAMSYLCFGWVLIGCLEQNIFRILLLVTVFYYGFMVVVGIIIGYKSIVDIYPRMNHNDLNAPQDKPFPLAQMVEVTKILIVALILFKHFFV